MLSAPLVLPVCGKFCNFLLVKSFLVECRENAGRAANQAREETKDRMASQELKDHAVRRVPKLLNCKFDDFR